MRRPTQDEGRQDEGQIMLLSLAYAVLALLLVTAIASASGVHLERKRLLALADQSALAATAALDEAAYYRRGEPPDRTRHADLVVLSPAGVRAAVHDHLAVSPGAARLTGLTVVEATTHDGRTAVVTLRAVARPAFVRVAAAWSGGVTLHATASARAG